MPIRDILTATLTERLRARDRDTVAAVRAALAAIDNAEAVPTSENAGDVAADEAAGEGPRIEGGEHVAGARVGLGAGEVPRRELTEEQMRALVAAEADERAELSRRLGDLGDSEAARRAFEQAMALRFLLDRARPD